MRHERQLGLRIKAFRLERRLTQQQLAEKLDRSIEAVSNIERGISVPGDATLHRLAKVLDVSLDDLLIERITRERNRPIEYFQATELLKSLDERKLKLTLSIIKLIADS